ncbi:SDR family NAD(P)-dependent oxidoreductase [Niastella caeni]|uniref:SDR family NAD(P)-dependent oxidoreductase n=1 Tax=Niastella caeni TaxID=2569763 RepID=A0A4S8HD11_9BACT|nr:SDR family NAD(P)-dependent oxidoreductase [Niastella caeni]THU31989.1 SDR family NAD(P)-dependent oxidoreductase [Niastella caeni]
MKTVLITGATSGFGKAMAEKFASHNNNVIITGRRADRLEALAKDLIATYKVQVHSLVFDVRDRKAVFSAIEQLPPAFKKIDILINNAGLALGRDYFEDAETEDWEIMLDTNVKGVMYVTKAVLPGMIERKQGHIINMGSIAGKEVYEKGNGYCASKYALDALSQSMRVDLVRHKIKVTAIHPGAAETEFSMVRFKGNTAAADKMYEGYQPLSAADVADVVYYTATLPAHVCINDLVLTCLAQANSFYLNK